jgi:acyl-CoA thioesterase I
MELFQELFKPNSRVLFQGDSITECGRDAANPASLGIGYVFNIAEFYTEHYPKSNITFLNRGVGGNRVRDLKARWQTDTIDLKPDWVSILIGINDTFFRYSKGETTTVEEFECDYRYILAQTKAIGARIVMMEQFAIPLTADEQKWREDLDPKIQVTRRLAREFNAIFIPFDGIFAAQSVQSGPATWTNDNIHPWACGHALLAKVWMRAVADYERGRAILAA